MKAPKWWSWKGRELAPPWTIARRVTAWPLMMAARLAEIEGQEPVAQIIGSTEDWLVIERIGGHDDGFERGARLYARPVPAIPDGWRLVPKKLTQEMRAEFVRAAREYMREYGGNSPEVMYEAAVAAAPKAAR